MKAHNIKIDDGIVFQPAHEDEVEINSIFLNKKNMLLSIKNADNRVIPMNFMSLGLTGTTLIRNGDFAHWSNGDNDYPDYWSGNLTAVKKNTGRFIVNGASCLCVGYSGSNDITQEIYTELNTDKQIDYYANKHITLCMMVWCPWDGTRIKIDDGINVSSISVIADHSWKQYIVTHKVSNYAKYVRCGIDITGHNDEYAYIDAVVVVEGELPFAFNNHPADL